MAEDIQRPDITARATLVETPYGPLTADEQLAQQLQQQLAKERAENPRSALEGLKNKMDIPPERVKESLENAIGTERDPNNGRKILTGAESARKGQAETYSNNLRSFIDKGFDRLNAGEQAFFVNEMKKVINSWESGREIFRSMSAAEQSAAIRSLLQKPEMAPMIHKALEGALGNLPKDLDKDLIERHRKAQQEKVDAEGKRTKVDTEKNKAQTEVDSYVSKKANTPGKELADLKGKEPQWDQRENDANKDIRKIDSEASSLKRKLDMAENYGVVPKDPTTGLPVKDLPTYISELEGKLEKKMEERAIAEQKLRDVAKERGRYETLLEEKKLAEGKLKEIEAKFEEADETVKKADRVFSEINVDMNLAKLDRAKAEEVFVKGIQDAAAEGMLEYLTKTAEAHEKAAQSIIEKKKNEDKEKADVAITSAMSNRWNTEKTFRRLWWSSKVWEPNKQQINTDMEYVLNEPATGPKDLLGAIMADAGVPVDVVQEKLKDQAWLDKNVPQVMERLVARGIQNGKLKQGEIRRIADTDWGKDILSKAINQNRDVRRQIDEGVANGVIRGDVGEFFAKTENKDILAALLAVLGGAAGAVFAGPALAAAGAGWGGLIGGTGGATIGGGGTELAGRIGRR